MTDEQFERLIGKLEEIRCGIIDTEIGDTVVNECDSITIISKIRTAFFQQLEGKTGWGRNEIKAIFEIAVESAL